ncbi:glycoside hydrolase [Delphinella strobiligena]|nr:glycoside hydrolase [Delphinella strobiligena]
MKDNTYFMTCSAIYHIWALSTVNNTVLQTWWHNTGEINTQTAVQPGNVRQSHLYSIQVTNADDQVYYDSFVYETIPRNGQGNILIPNDPSSTTTNSDGITIEAEIGMSMSWSSFLYSADVWVKVHRLDGFQIQADSVVIRPTNLNYTISADGGDYFIHVPYSADGSKFAIEFYDNMYSFHDGSDTPSSSYAQNTTSSGSYYVPSFTDEMPIMGTEPLNQLLIFASPFEDADLVPDQSASDALVVPEGRVLGLNTTTASTVIFNPGVYYFTSTDHMLLSPSVNWLYFAPGAYVKAAVEYTSTASAIKVTGHGVLSGEQYVYQADPTDSYQNHNVNASPLRMWKGTAGPNRQTTWLINGPTMNSPPFNSMDWIGNLDSLSVLCTDYKQVGGYFSQTDGMEMYSGSVFKNLFYHTNDDTIKTYHSNISATNILVQKASTAPVLQFGWANRNLSDVTVANVTVIHSRWNSNLSNPGLVGSNNLYDPSTTSTSATNYSTASTSSLASNIFLSNFRAEGISGPLFRIYALENLANITLANFWIEGFGSGNGYDDVGIPESFMPAMRDAGGKEVSVGGFVIRDFFVGVEKVGLETAGSVGRLFWDDGFGVTIE